MTQNLVQCTVHIHRKIELCWEAQLSTEILRLAVHLSAWYFKVNRKTHEFWTCEIHRKGSANFVRPESKSYALESLTICHFSLRYLTNFPMLSSQTSIMAPSSFYGSTFFSIFTILQLQMLHLVSVFQQKDICLLCWLLKIYWERLFLFEWVKMTIGCIKIDVLKVNLKKQ